MGQENEHEQNGAHEHEGCEETKVAQGWRIERHQAGESTHGGNVSYEQRSYHFLVHIANGAAMICVGNEVKRIVNGNAYDD